MRKKTEKLILEMLKDRVIEKDRELEEQEVHESTKEALAEMTSLSKDEVDDIYEQIRKEVKEKKRKRNKNIVIISSIIIIIALITLPRLLREVKPPITFTDDFNNSTESDWKFEDKYISNNYYESSEFIIDAKLEGNSVTYLDIPFEFPKNFTLEIGCKYYEGDKEGYGFYIGEDKNNFAYFFVRSDRYFRNGICVKGNWQTSIKWKNDNIVVGNANSLNHIKIEVKGNDFDYYINDKKMSSGNLYNIKLKKYSVAVVGEQKVGYDYIRIISDKKDTLFYDNFNEKSDILEEKQEYTKKSEYKDGKFIISVNNPDYCYWAKQWMPEELIGKDCEIIIKARSYDAENDCNFGFMLMHNDDNYFAFEVKNNNEGRVLISNFDKYSYIGTYVKSGKYIENENIEIKIRIENKYITYFLNDKKIDMFPILNLTKTATLDNALSRIALRVCDKHTVAFDRIEFKQIKDN